MRALISSFAVGVLLISASCGSKPEPTASAGDRAPEAAAAPSPEAGAKTLELSAEALTKAHIVWQPVQTRSIPQTLRAPGRITMNENRVWRVGTLTEGLVVDLSANVDDFVQQGQVLARLHSHAVHDGRADYSQAKSNLATLETRRMFLATQAERMHRLLQLKAASEQQVQAAESELRDVQGLIESAQADVERHRIHLEEFLHVAPDLTGGGAKVNGYHAADLIPIRAPAAGVLMERTVAPGTVVSAGQPVCVISDLSSVWMMAEVQQQHLPSLKEGMLVQVRSQANPEMAFAGRVRRIGSELNAASRTVMVRIEVPNPGMRLRPEMYADAEIAVGGSLEGMFVKQGAIQELNGQSIVFVKTGELTFELRAVDLGEAIDGLRRIHTGVSPGEQLVVDGSFLLKSKLLEASLAEE